MANKVWIVISADTGGDETEIVDVFDSPEKAAECEAKGSESFPRYTDEWEVS